METRIPANFVESSIFEKRKLNLVAKEYSPLHYTPRLIELLERIYPLESLKPYCKFELHKILNDTIISTHQGELGLKYALFKTFQKKDLVAAFEMNVKTSRVDFVAINGQSTSFEIKSNLDNLTKLSKQAYDYLLAFEYNNVVIHERHIKKAISILPESFGIWTFKGLKKSIIRPSTLNQNTNAEAQLDIMTKKELTSYFGFPTKIEVLSTFDKATINKKFKGALKGRYATRWDFVVTNSERILPIDIQFFFNKNISPEYIYS